MSVDLRIRCEADIRPVAPTAFFAKELPALAASGRGHIQAWLAHNRLEDFTLECDGHCWQLSVAEGQLSIAEGQAENGTHVRISGQDFSAMINDELTPIAFYTTGDLGIVRGSMESYLDWWLVLRALIDDRPLYLPGTLAFLASDGTELDLSRRFCMDDSVAEMSHFLEAAGFLHIEGVFSEAEMDLISHAIDQHQQSYAEGDGKSWWATTQAGARRVVRMQAFDEMSPDAARLLGDPRLQRISTLGGDGHVQDSLANNRIEALVKPLGVVDGVSDLPWHKDCAQGRHSLDCCGLTVGISVTGADRESGQIRVIAGSHRALIRPSHIGDPKALGLPIMNLPTHTGDITVHLSCTLHMAQAPKTRERRVLYTGFRLPRDDESSHSASRERLSRARESAQHMSDKPR